MRKHVIDRLPQDAPKDALNDESHWLDLVHIACVEVTSEDESHPIESALMTEAGAGWRASQPGEQIIRLLFDKPQQIGLIELLFVEDERARTQEYVLRWSRNEGTTYQEILRQQYNFSPPDTIRESEVHVLNLDGITALELSIVPDISGEDAYASLACLRLA